MGLGGFGGGGPEGPPNVTEGAGQAPPPTGALSYSFPENLLTLSGTPEKRRRTLGSPCQRRAVSSSRRRKTFAASASASQWATRPSGTESTYSKRLRTPNPN
jgi:hypothetical protein